MFSALEGWRRQGYASSGAPRQPTMRQVLGALDVGEAVQWTPTHSAWLHGTRYGAACTVTLLLVAGGAWLAANPPAMEPERSVLAAISSPRIQQIASTARPPLEQAAESAKSDQPPPALVVGDAIAIEAGQRVRLSAHVDNNESVQPETVALVKGLPGDVRLTDGIMIGPGLWMLRPNLLASVELDASSSASGRHELTLELRTAVGDIISTGQTVLTIAAVRNEESKPDTAVRIVDEPAVSQPPSPPRQKSRSSRGIAGPATPGSASARKSRASKAHVPTPVVRPAPVVQKRGPARAKASVERKVKVAKPPRRTGPLLQSEVTVLSAKPVVPQSAQPPRLVWPGDDPRSASYSSNPPAFLGGAVPGSTPQAKPPVSGGDDGWRQRAFGQ